MPTLYETMRTWRDAHRSLSQQPLRMQALHQSIIDRLVDRLQRHRSLADLAVGYYRDGNWWLLVVREFCAEPGLVDERLIRNAAYYQRLLQIRRPDGR